MNVCDRQEFADVELYFYGELDTDARAAFERHLSRCGRCRTALAELSVIRDALESVPVVDAPPKGDWTGFMSGLGDAIRVEQRRAEPAPGFRTGPSRPAFVGYLAIAALLSLVTISVVYVSRTVRPVDAPPAVATVPSPTPSPAATTDEPGQGSTRAALARLSEQHLERSKLVVLGLANKDPRRTSEADWEYERELASNLLVDTRLYRMAAEERGMRTLASVMRDLELVLLQTSLAAENGSEDLEQIQRFIEKRDLLGKMNLIAQGI